MYCKYCGSVLPEDSRFCSKCGRKLTEAETEPVKAEEYGNSMFREETSPLNGGTKEEGAEVKPPVHLDEFSWNVDGYPTDTVPQTDDVDFNWESVLDERNRETGSALNAFNNQSEDLTESQTSEMNAPSEAIEDSTPLEAEDNSEAVSPEEILAELEKAEETPAVSGMDATTRFDRVKARDDDSISKFYTFTKKNEEFQTLLDKEYEKIAGNDFEPKEEKTKNDIPPSEQEAVEKSIDQEPSWKPPFVTTPVEEQREEEIIPKDSITEVEAPTQPVVAPVIPIEEKKETVESIIAQAKKDEVDEPEFVVSPKEEPNVPEVVKVVTAAAPPLAVIAAANKEEKNEPAVISTPKIKETVKPEIKQDELKEPAKENEKDGRRKELTFGDVFSDEVEEVTQPEKKKEKKEKKQGLGLKIVAVILCVLICLLVAFLVIYYKFPDTSIGQTVVDIYNRLYVNFAYIPDGVFSA